MSDHADIAREAFLHVYEPSVRMPRATDKHADDCPGCKGSDALDALVAERDEARESNAVFMSGEAYSRMHDAWHSETDRAEAAEAENARLREALREATKCNCLIRGSVSTCPAHLPSSYVVMKKRAEDAEALLALCAANSTAADLAQQIEFYKAGWINVRCEFGCGYDLDDSHVTPGYTIVPVCRIHGPLALLIAAPSITGGDS